MGHLYDTVSLLVIDEDHASLKVQSVLLLEARALLVTPPHPPHKTNDACDYRGSSHKS
jgi:hypothetical protein